MARADDGRQHLMHVAVMQHREDQLSKAKHF
jgi:hypothetical protein